MPQQEPPELTKRLSFDLPEPLHKRLKVACAQLSTKMKDEIIRAVERRIEELEDRADQRTGDSPLR